MKIDFITATTDMSASYRYRTGFPASYLASRGHITSIGRKPNGGERIVFSKHYNYLDYDEAIDAKTMGKKVFFDCCDWHLHSESSHGHHYEKMFSVADTIITSTPKLHDVLKEFGYESVMIPDTYEYPQVAPRFEPTKQLKLLWFGHFQNFDALCANRDAIRGHRLNIITAPEVQKYIKYPIIPFCISNMMMGFEWCDCVIVPQLLVEVHKQVKGANRLIESVRQGRFVVASPLEAYKQFSEWMWIGDIKEGLDWLTQQSKEEIEGRIKAAQEHIEREFNQERIGNLWEQTLSN